MAEKFLLPDGVSPSVSQSRRSSSDCRWIRVPYLRPAVERIVLCPSFALGRRVAFHLARRCNPSRSSNEEDRRRRATNWQRQRPKQALRAWVLNGAHFTTMTSNTTKLLNLSTLTGCDGLPAPGRGPLAPVPDCQSRSDSPAPAGAPAKPCQVGASEGTRGTRGHTRVMSQVWAPRSSLSGNWRDESMND